MKLIDKDKVREWLEAKEKREGWCAVGADVADVYYARGVRFTCDTCKDFLDTLEVKEVDSIWNDARKTIPEDSSNQIICIKEDGLAVATVGKLAHGTIKWVYLNDLLNISNAEVKEVNLEKEWKEYFKYRGDVSTVNLKHLAKHFFELGLKAMKGE